MNESNVAERPILADLVDLSVQVDRDADLNHSELRRRDRAIGQQFADLSGKPRDQLRQWLRETNRQRPTQAGDTAVRTLRRMGLVVALLGLLIGWGAALGIFSYDGTRPVNVVNVLAAFVGVQLLLLLLTAIVVLPRNLLQRVPGARQAQDVIGSLSPGRLVGVAARYLPAEHRLSLEAALGRHKASHLAYGHVQKWLILRYSQIVAVAFNVGALAGCLYLVTVSDLAFGWSTTLTVDSQSFHALITDLAWPWRAWLPGAVPSLEIIDATRYFRFDHGILPNAPGDSPDVVVLGQWWPFLLMAIACYGLLPRLGLFALAHWRLDEALKTALVHAPGALQILDRMNRAFIETAATEPEVHMQYSSLKDAPFPAPGLDRNTPSAYLINWAGISADEEQFDGLFQRTMGVAVERMLYAGRMDSLDEDEQTIDAVAKAKHNPDILVAVKSWEPPLLEFMDFLDALREAVGSERLITVTPIMFDHKREFVPADPDDLDVWKKRLQSRGDSRMDFLPVSAEAA